MFIPQSIKPSYATGFARNINQALHSNLWNGLIGAYSPALGNTGLVTLRDWSGRGFNGTMVGDPVTSDWSIDEGFPAFRFDGNDDYIIAGENSVQQVDNKVTVSLWWKRNGNQPRFGAIMINGDSSLTPFGAYEIQWNNNADDDLLWHIGTITGGTDLVSFGVTINDNQWYHLVGTYDNVIMREYVDGIETGTPTSHSGILDYGDPGEGLVFGAQIDPGNRFCPGQMGECLIFNRAFNASAVQQLFQIGPGGFFQLNQLIIGQAAVVIIGEDEAQAAMQQPIIPTIPSIIPIPYF